MCQSNAVSDRLRFELATDTHEPASCPIFDSRQRLCVFGLCGAIQILFYYLLGRPTNVSSRVAIGFADLLFNVNF